MVAPHLLEKIGLRFARCVLDKNLLPEQKLWGTLDPDDMYQCYRNALKTKKVYFTQRQVAWKRYDAIYRKMMSEDNKIVKKIKRKEVDKYRQYVKNTPDIVISTIFVSAFV